MGRGRPIATGICGALGIALLAAAALSACAGTSQQQSAPETQAESQARTDQLAGGGTRGGTAGGDQAPAHRATTASNSPPTLRFKVLAYDQPPEDLHYELVDPAGNSVWECAPRPKASSRFRLEDDRCSAASGWYDSGLIEEVREYQLKITYSPSDDSAPRSVRAPLPLAGEESEIQAVLRFHERVPRGHKWLHAFSVFIRMPPPSGLALQRRWTPGVDPRPDYEIVNGTSEPLIPADAQRGFSGHVEAKRGEGWRRVRRRITVCGMVGPAAPAPANSYVRSEEAPAIINSEPLAPGTYRYVVEPRVLIQPGSTTSYDDARSREAKPYVSPRTA